MKRAAIYARYSSDLQSPTSIDDQIALCRTHAERQGWIVADVFSDAALSGGDATRRPGYQRLLLATETRSFDVILVEDLSRLTREIGETDRLRRRMQLRRIDIVGVSDGIDTSRRGATMQIGFAGLKNAADLEALQEKTHRGLAGGLERGMTTGGRLFGYRTVLVPSIALRARQRPSRPEIHEPEAAIVRRIFTDYAAGRSTKAIAYALNAEGVAFPAKDTKRGPARMGWAFSTIAVMLRNEKYIGVWTWNRTRFLKDPDTGRRRPIERPKDEWIRKERPELRIIDDRLWLAVQERLRTINEAYQGVARGRTTAYSNYLLSGLLRCAHCGSRMQGQSAKKKKAGVTYRYDWYRCGFARDKGPTICPHRTWYRRDRLEGSLIAKFKEAMDPAVVQELTRVANEEIAAAVRGRDVRGETIKAEMLQLEREAGHLVRFVASGGDSPTLREELRNAETSLASLRAELAALDRVVDAVPKIHATWVQDQIDRLEQLLRDDVPQARIEIAKHLDGDLTITPRPGEPGEKLATITALLKPDGLLAMTQEAAVCFQYIAGARFVLKTNRPAILRLDVSG